MTTDTQATKEQGLPTARAVPLPAVGPVLAVCWSALASGWLLVSARFNADLVAQFDWFVAVAAAGVLLVVATPLLLTRIPGRLRVQALPFFFIAGVMTMAEPFASAWIVPWLIVDSAVLYVIGWLRLRGRDPRLLLVGAGTPILYMLGSAISPLLVSQLVAALHGHSETLLTAAALSVQALLTGALPVCLPLAVASFINRPTSSASDTLDAPSSLTSLNSLAMASVVMGLMGGNVIAVVLGHIARAQIRRTKQAGERAAMAGVVLGYAGTLVLVVAAVLASMVSRMFGHFTY